MTLHCIIPGSATEVLSRADILPSTLPCIIFVSWKYIIDGWYYFSTFSLLQLFLALPNIIVTARHQVLKRPQDALAVWVEDLRKDSFKLCARETKIFDGIHKNIKVVSNIPVTWFLQLLLVLLLVVSLNVIEQILYSVIFAILETTS